jgi:HTH-type transcriptional regulator/antitoxin HipB
LDHIVRTPQQLASILKGWRTRRKLTQQDVAAKVGIKQSTVSVIEKDASHTEVDTLYKLLSALGAELVIRERGGSPKSRRARSREW